MLENRYSSLPPGVRNLLIITIVISIIGFIPHIAFWCRDYGGLLPRSVFKGVQIWRLATYMFLHGDFIHLLFNMLALWMFGVEIERRWGTNRFISFYFISGIGAGLFSFPMWNITIIGASGAVLALLTVYAVYYPNRQILMFFIFPVPVRLAVIIIGSISILIPLLGANDGIAHLTHLGGIVVALIYLKYYDHYISWLNHGKAVKAEKEMRRRAEKKIQKDRYFEEIIDPILKKISEKGMASLTKDEKRKLHNFKR